ncbi:hypothetical protein GGF39_002511 [Coemansia sp. RSA 1721]|nr:hypothetical protein GGF39_002511 [Coemansia sp. RSA 1721]
MLTLNVELDPSNAKCLVHKHRESGLRGKLHIRTSDKLKLRQISIRLVSTELVDLHDSESSNSLHPLLRKSSKAIGTWIIWKKGDSSTMPDMDSSRHAQGVLEPGDHHYSFEIPLPVGLDGTVATKMYSLRYELETRLEHSFKLKPDTVHATPVCMVQVPTVLNLHADDRISLDIVPVRVVGGLENFKIDDLLVGKSARLVADSIDRKDNFVLHHIWDNRLSFKIRMPKGRVFPVDSQPLVDVEAVPISKEYRFTKVSLALEEITIVARPTIAGITRHGSVSGQDGTQSPAKAKGQQLHSQTQSQSTRRPSLTGSVVSQASTNSEDAQSVKASHNAWAYAKECSSEYQNAITKVRELSRSQHALATQQQQQQTLHQGTMAAFHGILASKIHLSIPHTENLNSCADIRNSHIQVHHQLVYELEYQRLDVSELNEANAAFSAASADARIKAVAHVYKALGNANIVRRDELKDSSAGASRSGVIKGTVPVAVVPRRISDLWGIRNLSQDTLSQPSAVVAALMDVEQPSFYSSSMGGPSIAMPALPPSSFTPAAASMSFPAPPSIAVTADSSLSHAGRPGSVASLGTCASGIAANNGHRRGQSTADVGAMLMRNPSTSSQSKSSLQHNIDPESTQHGISQNAAYPPASASASASAYPQMPMAPMVMPQSTYPAQSQPALGFNMVDTGPAQYSPYPAQYPQYPPYPAMAAPASSSAYPMSPQPYPPTLSTSSTGTDSGTTGAATSNAAAAHHQQPMTSFGGMAFNPMMFQEQMRLFQEQQRQQQEQFFKQLSEQYAQMMMSSSLSAPNNQAVSAGPSVSVQQSTPVAVAVAEQSRNAAAAAAVSPYLPAQSDVSITETAAAAAGPVATQSAVDLDLAANQHPTPVRNSLSVQSAHSMYEMASESLAADSDGALSVNGHQQQQQSQTESSGGPTVPAAVSAAAPAAAALPPSYDDIMPPEYDIPTHQPPPYQPVDTANARRRSHNQ